jgi:soluble lytic murein transglycosylase-like protein
MSLSNRRVFGAIVLLAAAIFVSQPASGQIASYVDEHGKLIYVNGDSPQPRRGGNISSPSTAKALPVASMSQPSTKAADFAAPSPNGAGSPAQARPETLSQVPAQGSTEVNDPRLDRIVQEAAQRHSLDPALVKAVITTESGWNARAISQKGAVGLMQLIPSTAQRFGVGNPFDPAQNVEGGTTYLKALLDRYNGDLTKSLAAYNAGERAVDLSGGVPAYRETQRYVQKVTDAYFRPGSGRTSTLWSPPRPPVRQEVGANGRVVFTNE